MRNVKILVMALAVLLLGSFLRMDASAAEVYPESDHSYAANTDQTWTYQCDAICEEVYVTFSSDTSVENNYDKIYIYDLNDVLVGTYTGTQLASQTVTVPGSGFKVRLTSDGSVSYYGFKVTNVEMKLAGAALESEHNYASNTDYTWTYDACEEREGSYLQKVNVTFSEDTYVEEEVDFIYIYDLDGEQIGKYTGAQLAGQTIAVEDVGFKVRLTSDASNEYYGFAINLVEPVYLEYPESDHDYGDYADDSWTFNTRSNVSKIKITFSSSCYLENNRDFIYIYNAAGTEVGKYTGSELAGKTVTVNSTGFKIRLTSDYSIDYYGFAIDDITTVKRCLHGTKTSKTLRGVNIKVCSACGQKFITKAKMTSCTVSKITAKTYTGKAIKPTVTVKRNGFTLKKGTDYTVSYANNTKAGTATITIKGKGSYYTGTVKKTFKINKANVSKCKVNSISAKTYTGKAIKPTITMKLGTVKMTTANYKLSYKNNTKAGTATITITGKNNLTGTKKVTFKINGKLNYTKKNLYKGKSFTLKLKGATTSKVKFSSSKKSVCTVSSSGKVKAKKAGSCKIYAKYNGKKYTCSVKVLNVSSSSSKDTTYYKNHDDVPDFGALVKIDPTSSYDGSEFVYSISDLQNVDPSKEAGDKYRKLLVKEGFEYKGTVYKSSKKYYKYVSKKKVVYFGIASYNNEVRIIIDLK